MVRVFRQNTSSGRMTFTKDHKTSFSLEPKFIFLLNWLTCGIHRQRDCSPVQICFFSPSTGYITCPAYASIWLDTAFRQTLRLHNALHFSHGVLPLASVSSACCGKMSNTFRAWHEKATLYYIMNTRQQARLSLRNAKAKINYMLQREVAISDLLLSIKVIYLRRQTLQNKWQRKLNMASSWK